jgi:hypothetical protein
MPSRLGFALLTFAACQHIDDVELDGPTMPAASEELQRLNIDAVPGIAPVRVTTLEDPRFSVPRERTIQQEDRPPPEPLRPRTAAQNWFLGLTGAERKVVGQICREGRNDPCFGMLPLARGAAPRKMDQLLALLGAAGHQDRHQVHDYCRERDPRLICDTPLVASFDGEPVVFESSAATFAFQPGLPVHTAWPTAATPWIAIDLDGDGAITSGAELFGDATTLPSGAKATNGFTALAALDANHDGVIDARDPAFAQLVLWADRDPDRKTTPSELRPLAEVVSAIPLAHALVPRCVDGGCEGQRATMAWRDASGRARTGAVIDIYLQRR